jgi:hypothetical protein
MNGNTVIQPEGGAEPREELQNKDLGEILGGTFRIYFQGFLKFMALAVIGQGTIYGIGILWILPDIVPNGAALSVGFSAVYIIPIIVVVILGIWMHGAIIHTTAGHNLENKSDLGRSMLTGWRRMARMIGAGALILLLSVVIAGVLFVMTLLSILGILIVIFVVFPISLFIMIKLYFVFHAVVIEGTGPIAAFTRSSELVQDNWWRTFGITLLMGIIFGIIGLVLNSVTFFIPETEGWFVFVWQIITAILTAPLAVIASTLLYYDLRSRDKRCTVEEAITELDTNGQPKPYSTGNTGPGRNDTIFR